MRIRPVIWLAPLAPLLGALALSALGRSESPAPPLQPGQSWQPFNDSFGFVIQEATVSSSTATTLRFSGGTLERSSTPAPGAQSRTVLVAFGMLRRAGVWHHVYAVLPAELPQSPAPR